MGNMQIVYYHLLAFILLHKTTLKALYYPYKPDLVVQLGEKDLGFSGYFKYESY